ncbi:hypothetical protein [Alicycliphilus denitrificans]|uniref:hypothetical protein n=1 Tax=Alicycliphilus denitrificans TaxID=179636 RepID=UPI00384C0634
MPLPFHASTRTALSQNLDPASGLRTRVLTTSKLELAWQAGELVVRCAVARAVISGHQEPARTRRWARGEQ